MDGVRLLKLIDEYQDAKFWARSGEDVRQGRSVEEIARDVEETLQAILTPSR